MEVVGEFLAETDRWGHMSGWGWGLMIFGSLFWAAMIGLVVWTIIRNPEASSSQVHPETTLAHRFARGEISAEEFTERRDVLRERKPGPAPPVPSWSDLGPPTRA